MSLPRHTAQRDANEAPIVEALRTVGALVFRLNAEDLPDLMVGYRGRWILIEIKRPAGPRGGTKDRVLRPGQRRFFADALDRGLPVAVVHGIDEALDVVGVRTVTR